MSATDDAAWRAMATKIVDAARQPERGYLIRRGYVEMITQVLRIVRDAQRERDTKIAEQHDAEDDVPAFTCGKEIADAIRQPYKSCM